MRPVVFTALALLALGACRNDPDKPDTDTIPLDDTAAEPVDADGDGFSTDDDCDDGDPEVFPGADERCDGVDNDCDGDIDEEAVDATPWHIDGDEDGYGDPDLPIRACEAPDGYVEDGSDCDDGDPETHPEAPERCDGRDNDCDGEIDEELNEVWYADADGDGFGNAANVLDSCDPGEGWVADATDCDDTDSTVFPGAEEVCNDADDDCDGELDEGLESSWYADDDGDGFGAPDREILDCEPGAGWVENAEDCDDANSGIHPDAAETCDTIDNDCDGLVDDLDDPVEGTTTWYTDADGDGYGDDASSIEACEQPSGTAAYGGDCDDADAAYNPGASEDDCTDPADYNCDGSTGYADDDGDGWAACEDCDDGDAAVNPDADELCNNVDDDCDGDIDEDDATDAVTWYADADADGYGDSASTTLACDPPSGYVAAAYATDCDDLDATVSPVAAERCDGVDNDCDGDVDEGVTDIFYADMDGDGYGDAGSSVEDCSLPSGYSADDTDCDDGDAAIHPAAAESCDGVDNDCDGLVDDDDSAVSGTSTWYQDDDGDGFGDASAPTSACSQPSDHAADSTDCDDDNNTVYPGAAEICDGLDGDCDGAVDEGVMLSWYADGDGDGYGDASASSEACSAPGGSVADSGDCDDGDAAINPGASELCDGVDNDCDGRVDEDDAVDADTWYIDADGDGYGSSSYTTAACSQPSGYVADSTDCDDFDGDVNPSAAEICDGVDDDCDGLVDDDDGSVTGLSTWYLDADADGWGDGGSSLDACEAPSGYTADGGDCDDGDDAIHPDAAEVCDGVDNDCDGTADSGTVDTDGDGLCNDIDPDVYSYDYDDGAWTGWSYVDLGGGNAPNWAMAGGVLVEASNAAHTIAYGPDLGPMDSYTITVDTAFGGAATDRAAIVFGMVDVDEFWLADWHDPTGYYGIYSPTGHLSVQQCLGGSCFELAGDDGSTDLGVGYSVWSELSVTVDGDDVYVYLDGVEYVHYAGSGLAPIGADIVGVYSRDCDGGVYYDNFEVTNP
jgi:hypothetical protein